MSAALKRRVALLESQLAAEATAHVKTTDVYRSVLYELIELRLRSRVAIEALHGRDYFGVAE